VVGKASVNQRHRKQKLHPNVLVGLKLMFELFPISLQATFFASTESGMLAKVLPTSNEVLSTAGQIANVCFICALVVHAFAGKFLLPNFALGMIT
jgi:hypothetical protein